MIYIYRYLFISQKMMNTKNDWYCVNNSVLYFSKNLEIFSVGIMLWCVGGGLIDWWWLWSRWSWCLMNEWWMGWIWFSGLDQTCRYVLCQVRPWVCPVWMSGLSGMNVWVVRYEYHVWSGLSGMKLEWFCVMFGKRNLPVGILVSITKWFFFKSVFFISVIYLKKKWISETDYRHLKMKYMIIISK